MVTQARGGLGEAYRAERDSKVAGRILAIHYVEDMGIPRELAAEMLFCSSSSIDNWVARYAEGGVDALRDLPRSGRPRKVGRAALGRIMDRVSRPHVRASAMREEIRARTGILYHIGTVRLRMRECGLSPKRAHPVHVNRACDATVSWWQWGTKKRIGSLGGRGFTVVAQDEAILLHDTGGGPWLWARRGERASVPYTGSHRKLALYASITRDGRRCCAVHKKFDAPTFLGYLRKLHKRFGRVAVILDRAPQHRARAARGFLRECDGEVVLLRLPVGTPELNVVEGLWHQLRRILAGMYFSDFGDFRRKVGALLRTMPHSLDMLAHLYRRLRRDPVAPRR